jgi:hypothetical protein
MYAVSSSFCHIGAWKKDIRSSVHVMLVLLCGASSNQVLAQNFHRPATVNCDMHHGCHRIPFAEEFRRNGISGTGPRLLRCLLRQTAGRRNLRIPGVAGFAARALCRHRGQAANTRYRQVRVDMLHLSAQVPPLFQEIMNVHLSGVCGPGHSLSPPQG